MKKILLVLLICCSIRSHGQVIDSTNIAISNAINLLQGTQGRIDKPKAFELLKRYAIMGIPKAMNALGLGYMNGQGAPIDTIKGLQLLETAGELGYPIAWHNLGIIYKYGSSGVKQNMGQAFYYMERAAKEQNQIGLFDAGYMLYKGLGCTQDYTKAFAYFKQASDKGYPPSMYMLGLCYRNGYGVARSTGDANYWLSLASSKGIKPAANEIAADEPENTVKSIKVKGTSTLTLPGTFTRIPQLKSLRQKQVDGDYEGILVTYDWSGKLVLSETPFSLTLNSTGDKIEVEWREQGVDTVKVMALWQDTCLMFTQALQGRKDHYSGTKKVIWNFTNARLQLLNDSIGSYLTGNVQMYSPETMEPHRPLYISLHKTSSGNSLQLEKIATSTDIFNVYPNPFSEGLNVNFYQPNESNVKTAVYDSNGHLVYYSLLGKYAAGQLKLMLPLPLPSGVYLFKIITGTKEYQTILIRK